MSVYPNGAKQRLENAELALGFVLRQARTVDIGAIGKACGFDWVSIDLEHSSLDVDTAAQIAGAALLAGITPIVRVPGEQHANASRLLDSGAQGVIVPHVDTAKDAAFVVSYCKYPPVGRRSVASVQPQTAFQPMRADEAMRLVNDETLVVVMLETPESIENAEEIASVPGVDVLLIGSHDLCAEMGIAGQLSHPRLEEAYGKVALACRNQGKHAGMAGIHDPKLAQKFVGFGIRFITAGTDLSFLMQGMRERSAFLRTLQES